MTLDNLSTGWRDAVKFGPLVVADLLDRDALAHVFAAYQPEAVMHFAALSQVGESVAEPGLYWRNNVQGSLNLIEAAASAGCLDFVFSSTCATYGEHDGVLLDEATPQRPTNPYGASKRAVEDMRQEMSIVGPRPGLPAQEDLHKLRQENGAIDLLPGITGLAQIKSYDGMTNKAKAALDGDYAKSVSLLTDFKIIISTFIYFLKCPPTY